MSDVPWIDLPTPLAEKILEGLPLSGYIRFGAVCRRWRSIQVDHRRRHAPSLPPMLRLPWFIHCRQQQETVSCYSPFEDRSYRIRIPKERLQSRYIHFLAGWLQHDDAILNPISGVEIPFPESLRERFYRGIVHAAAVSPPPNFAIFVILNLHDLFLFRQGDQIWTQLRLPLDAFASVAFAGKLYCTCTDISGAGNWDNAAEHLAIIDPLLTMPPAFHLHKMMDWSQAVLSEGFGRGRLVESNGEVLMVREIFEHYRPSVRKGFQVFRPNLSDMVWTRVESLGDQSIFLHGLYSVSLPATIAGLRPNCIYFSIGSSKAPWEVFDLGLETMTAASFPNSSLVDTDSQRIFVPSLF